MYFDATDVKSREDGRIVNVAVVLAVGVTDQGYRKILGSDLVTSESGTSWCSWTSFLRGRVAAVSVACIWPSATTKDRRTIASTLPGRAASAAERTSSGTS